MNKYLLAIFSVFILAVCVYAGTDYNTQAELFLTPNKFFTYSRVVVASILLGYSLFYRLLVPYGKILMRGLGYVLLGVGVAGIISPTYFGLLQQYALPADIFIALEAGICSLLASLYLSPQPHPKTVLVPRQNTASYGVAGKLANA